MREERRGRHTCVPKLKRLVGLAPDAIIAMRINSVSSLNLSLPLSLFSIPPTPACATSVSMRRLSRESCRLCVASTC